MLVLSPPIPTAFKPHSLASFTCVVWTLHLKGFQTFICQRLVLVCLCMASGHLITRQLLPPRNRNFLGLSWLVFSLLHQPQWFLQEGGLLFNLHWFQQPLVSAYDSLLLPISFPTTPTRQVREIQGVWEPVSPIYCYTNDPTQDVPFKRAGNQCFFLCLTCSLSSNPIFPFLEVKLKSVILPSDCITTQISPHFKSPKTWGMPAMWDLLQNYRHSLIVP